MKKIYKVLETVASILLAYNILGIVLTFIGNPWAKVYRPETLGTLVLLWIIIAVIRKPLDELDQGLKEIHEIHEKIDQSREKRDQ